MKSLNPNLFPKGGHFFKEKDGARIFGDTWPGVIRRVISYRQRAKYDVGDVTAEVIGQACAREPVICTEESQVNQIQLKKSSLKSRILGWLSGLRARREKEPIEFAPEEHSRNRATICASCPHNQPLPDGCASCKAAVKELRGEIIGPRFQDGRLNGCLVLGEDLQTSVWVEQQTEDNGDLPPQCWRKRTL